MFLIAGGPGTSTVELYTSSAEPFDRVRRDRDIVLLDQRGTGQSHRLDCKYADQNVFERLDEIEVGPENIKCRDELSKNSDLRFYTTSIAVKDLDAVRLALGYERINLYGNSYGTRVAQHYARRYPQATRALILDGVVNPEVVLGPAIAIDAERALERILQRCKADASCAKAFGDPFADYHALRERLAQHARTVHGRAMPPPAGPSTSNSPTSTCRRCCDSPATTTTRPRCCRCRCTWRCMKTTSCRSPTSSACSRASLESKPSPTACTTAWPAAKTRRSSIPPSSTSRRCNATHMGAEQVQQLIDACRDWPKGVVDADLHAPFKSDAAALLLSGADDPVTPPEYAAAAQRAFADSKHVIIAAHGHGQLDRALRRPRDRGLRPRRHRDEPRRRLARRKLPPMPFFTTLAGPAP